MRFTIKGRDVFCNLCGLKMHTTGMRDGARSLMCPKCGFTIRVGKKVKDSSLFPTRKRRKRGGNDE